jgi:photosystem II stability/assembly factor-like uncharacterized protein
MTPANGPWPATSRRVLAWVRAAAAGVVAAAVLTFGTAIATTQVQPTGPIATSLTLFAGSANGLWRSRDWGGSWEKARPGEWRSVVPMGPQVFAGGPGGVTRSDDFGVTWTEVSADTPVLDILPSRYFLADPVVLAGTTTGLLKSDDGGRTFRPTGVTGTPVYRLDWPGPALLMATGRGVLLSPDSGATVTTVTAGLPAGEARALALSSFFSVDPVMFAGVGSHGVFRSGDAGKTWTPAGLTDHTVNDLVWLGPTLYAATDQGLFRSEDLGKKWTPLAEGLAGRAALRLMFPLAPDSGAEAFLGTDQGVFRTTDGGHRWMKTGLESEHVLCLATFPPPPPVLNAGKKKKR